MKIAFCFSGYPRFVNQSFRSIKENCLDRLPNYSIYAHFQWSDDWMNQKIHHEFQNKFSENELQMFVEKYTPYNLKTINVVKPYQFDVSCITPISIESDMNMTPEVAKDCFYRLKCQYQSISDCIRSIENLHEYDFVVRMRTDLIFNMPIECSMFDKNKVITQSGFCAGSDREHCDWFIVCPTEKVGFFHELSNMEEHFKTGVIHMHKLIKSIGQKYNIDHRQFFVDTPSTKNTAKYFTR